MVSFLQIIRPIVNIFSICDAQSGREGPTCNTVLGETVRPLALK